MFIFGFGDFSNQTCCFGAFRDVMDVDMNRLEIPRHDESFF